MVKIAIIGPESTGKSVLSENLAKHYNSIWIPEYAREYLEGLNSPYTRSDLTIIAKKQIELEDNALSEEFPFIFCDTNLVVIKIWSDYKYANTDPWIEKQLAHRHYDYYLLTNIDLAWTEDPLREHPHKRDEIFQLYQEYLQSHQLPYSLISGTGKDRTNQAIRIIDELNFG